MGYPEGQHPILEETSCQFCAYFSIEVAKLVTQPLWPSRVPFRISCSVMLGGIDVSFELKVVKA